MKRRPIIFTIILLLLISRMAISQLPHWQQQVDMNLAVSLNDKEHLLQGTAAIRYYNNSPDTLNFIWLHCWPNAYRNDHTAFSEQLLKNNRTDFYFSPEKKRGYINQLQFTVDGKTAAIEDHPIHQDILKLLLPKPMPPGSSTLITTPFQIKLPDIFSRMGYHEGFYAITQWYPKPAVYDQDGWHPMPYLDQGEFYSEYGNYTVAITVPDKFIVAATGRSADTLKDQEGLNGQPVKTIIFRQNNIHDFAWFASKDFNRQTDTLVCNDGRTIKISTYASSANQEKWKYSMAVIKSAIRLRNQAIGEYPYDDISLVDGYQGEGSGGMEYPTIAVINTPADTPEFENTVAHEIGHNWFYAALGSNERQDPWLDEGLNTYYDRRFENSSTKRPNGRKNFPEKSLPDDTEQWLVAALESIHRDQPINTSSDSFNSANYGLVAYTKAATWFEGLEHSLGRTVFDSCIRAYYHRYKFSHVHLRELQEVFVSVSGQRFEAFGQLNKTGPLSTTGPKKIKPAFIFNSSEPDRFKTIGIGPLPGYNKYDGLMIGAFIHNYQLPLPRFRFLLMPMYGTKSGAFAGLGNVSYTVYPSGKLQQAELGITAARFTGYESTINDQITKLKYQKIVPYIKLTAKEKDPISKKERFAAFKSFFFVEDEIGEKSIPRNLQQLKLYYADHRVLYPYEIDATMDITKDITRLALTGMYYFNYADQKGGLQVRLFAGKLFYNREKTLVNTLENDRYLLNLTGANGYEDFTYSNYFVGRNEFSGWMSQQIMIRDGGFKVRTDLNSNKVGKTDNWLMAVNLTSTIPNRYNPLSLLPLKIPLKLFADIGTYAEAWDTENEYGRILFDAGIQLSLLKETINIYLPIFNSQVFRDYNKSVLGDKIFLKTISFSIDIQKFTSRKLLAKAGL